MKKLTVRNQQMISLRLEGKTLEEIGSLFGVTRERVRQITLGYKKPKKIQKELTEEEKEKIKEEKRKRRFWSLVNKETNSDCWEWQGYITPMGYGKLGNEYTHRIAYKYILGEIPDDMCVLHKCDNPKCVYPFHLFLGTQSDNIKDRNAKGRTKIGNGKNNRENRILTMKQANQIREERCLGHSIASIARKYKIHYQTAHNIVSNKTYKK